MNNLVKTDSEISAMRDSGRILARVLDILRKESRAGLTPKDMSKIAAKEAKSLGADPAFLGFQGYPDVICISVNEQVQHAIPDDRPLKNGDIVNYDFGVRYKGMITDAGISVCIGNKPSEDAARLLEGTEQALASGIKAVKANCHVGDVSNAIETILNQYKLGIVKELVGHGVGYQLHEGIEIPNYGHSDIGPTIKAGMTLAIEPIATLGSPEIVGSPDGWTLLTADGSWSCQFEHTVLVLPDGAEILTKL